MLWEISKRMATVGLSFCPDSRQRRQSGFLVSTTKERNGTLVTLLGLNLGPSEQLHNSLRLW